MKLFSDSLPFFKGNFHCHTTESDGRLAPADVVKFYKDRGYNILSITDHRTVTPPPDGTDLLLIPGIEIDYKLPGQWAHILGLGMNNSIPSRWNWYGDPQEGIDLISMTQASLAEKLGITDRPGARSHAPDPGSHAQGYREAARDQ